MPFIYEDVSTVWRMTSSACDVRVVGAVISTADLNDPRSLQRVLEGAHAVFLTTHYWEHFSKEKEISQVRVISLGGMSVTKHSHTSIKLSSYFKYKNIFMKLAATRSIPYASLQYEF